MKRIDFLREQIIESRNFVNRLISEIPQDLWYTIPQNTDSNFAWQVGHLMISQNFHAGKSSVSCPLKPSDSAPLC